MGYYSEVAFMFSKETDLRFLSLVENQAAGLMQDIKDTLSCFTKRKFSDGSIVYFCKSIKWYTQEFSDVAFIHNFLHDLEADEYKYVVIGEAFDDITEEGCYGLEGIFESIYVTRSLSIPTGGRKCRVF